MSDPQQSQGAPVGAQQPTSSRKPVLVVVALAAVAILAIGGYLLRGKQQQAASPASSTQTATKVGPSSGDVPVVPSKPLPPLTESDPRVRELVGLLSPEPELHKWLSSTQDLARRFATAVSNIAEGESPRASLAFMAPPGAFKTVERGGHAFVAPASFARYDVVARVLTSLDTQASVMTYRALKPLFDRAYQEIGRPGQTFDQAFTKAIQKMVDTPVPEGDIEVVPAKGTLFGYAAPELEQLSAAQKHLLRMGPANARAIQAKLREFQSALQSALSQPAPTHH